MSKRVLAIVLLLMAVAAPSAPVVEAHNDDADVVIEWNGILQSTVGLALELPYTYHCTTSPGETQCGSVKANSKPISPAPLVAC